MSEGEHGAGFDLRGESTDPRTYVREIWRSRSLIRVLSRKDFLVRYRRASFGVIWAVAIPALQAAVLALVLPRFVRFEIPGSYIVFVFGGTTAFTFFAGSLSGGAGSIIEGQGLSTKVYFPRIVPPLVNVAANAYGMVVSVAVLALAAVASGDLGFHLLVLVPAMALLVLLSASAACLLAALQVYFRDVRYIVTAALVGWIYITPVIYPLSAVGSIARWLEINPMTGVVQLFRLGSVGVEPGWVASVWWSIGWTVVLFAGAVLVHRRYDRVFVDLL